MPKRPLSSNPEPVHVPAPTGASPLSEYLVAREPGRRERAENWRVAIGLQKVDGLEVSPYLLELARKNIEGLMTNEEVRLAIHAHYDRAKKSPRP